MNTLSDRSLVEALHAAGPASDRADKLALYGWLVGRWEGEAVCHEADGTIRRGSCEVAAGWVLGGRAIQDVWSVPRSGTAVGELPEWGTFHGTTLRVYDPQLDAWHILWSDPLRQVYVSQIGRAEGVDIVQEGASHTGAPMRWRFTEIAGDSFHWIGEHKPAGSDAWRALTEYFVRRIAGAAGGGNR